MRIIKLGIPPKQELLVTTCSICTTEFEFCKSEAVKYYNKFNFPLHYGIKFPLYYGIKCPICGYEVRVKPEV